MVAIRNIELKNPIIIAPMAGISNGAFRELCLENGAGLVYSEMVSDKAIFYENKKTLDMLQVSEHEHPMALQLFGSELKTMVYAAKIMDKDTACDIIDINMGCPVNKVIKTGAGSALMKDEDKATAIVEAIVNNVNKPVTVKMRLGYDHNNKNYLSLAKKLEKVGVSAIALHGRTRGQMYEGLADWSAIKLLHDELSIPVFGNGDIKSVNDFVAHQRDCDAIMIGRAVVGNPFLIKEISNYLTGKENYEVSYKERFEACLKHADKLCSLLGEESAIRQLRGIAPHYLTGLYRSTFYKNAMIKMNTYKDLEDLLKEYETVLEANTTYQ